MRINPIALEYITDNKEHIDDMKNNPFACVYTNTDGKTVISIIVEYLNYFRSIE